MKRSFQFVVIGSVFVGILLAVANAVLGPINHDEGWYLLASRFTAMGRAPYSDYAFSQGPFLPYFYGLFQRVWFHPGSLLGVLLSARFFTALLGLGACGLAAGLAWLLVQGPRQEGSVERARIAALATWLLTACSPVHSYFVTIPKTYALSSLLLVAGFLSLAYLSLLRARREHAEGRFRTPLAFNAGVFLGLAAATRLSLAMVLPATCLSLWLAAPRESRKTGFRDACFVAFGALFVLGLSVGRSVYLDSENTLAGIAMHAVREGGSWMSWLSLRAGFFSRTFQAYPLLWGAVAVWAFCRRGAVKRVERNPLMWALGGSLLLVSLLHVSAPLPYDDYQTPVMPLLAALVCAGLAQNVSVERATTSRPAVALLVLAGMMGLSSPLLMDWVTIRKDRFWFEMKTRPDVLVVRDAGREVRALYEEIGDEGSNLFTQDAYLAVESGLPVSPRLAMGPFSYYPQLDSDATKKRRVLNAEDVFRVWTSAFPPSVVATSGYTFAISSPSMERVPEEERQRLFKEMEMFYEPVKRIPNVGQGHTELTLWRRR